MRTKKEIIKNHKKEKKFKTTAVIYEYDLGGKKKPEFDVEFSGDVRGWHKKLTLFGSKDEGSPWVEHRKGTPFVTISDFDSFVEVQINRAKESPDMTISLSYCDLCDIVTAFQAMEYLHKKRTGRVGKTPVKIGKIKTKGL